MFKSTLYDLIERETFSKKVDASQLMLWAFVYDLLKIINNIEIMRNLKLKVNEFEILNQLANA